MTTVELSSRLAGILLGPWATSKRARRSTEYLAPPISFDLEAEVIDLSSTRAEKARDKQLQYLLAPQWIRPVSPDETWLRIGLDEALTAPMLLELAIECGYLDATEIRLQARKIIVPLLWSRAVQTYIIDYDYLTVLFLASRVGLKVDRVGALESPPIDGNLATTFSTFLAYYRVLFEDRTIWHFLRLLDDYTSRNIRKEHLWRALTREADLSDAIVDSAEGAIRFLEHLAAIDRLAQGTMRAPFGLFYAYWLAKFFGYELTRTGYQTSDYEFDWSQQVASLARIAQTKLDENDATLLASGAWNLWECARRTSKKSALGLNP